MDLFYRSAIFGVLPWWRADYPFYNKTAWGTAVRRRGMELRHATMLEF